MISHLLQTCGRTHGEGVVDVDETEEGQQGLHEQDQFDYATKGPKKESID